MIFLIRVLKFVIRGAGVPWISGLVLALPTWVLGLWPITTTIWNWDAVVVVTAVLLHLILVDWKSFGSSEGWTNRPHVKRFFENYSWVFQVGGSVLFVWSGMGFAALLFGGYAPGAEGPFETALSGYVFLLSIGSHILGLGLALAWWKDEIAQEQVATG